MLNRRSFLRRVVGALVALPFVNRLYGSKPKTREVTISTDEWLNMVDLWDKLLRIMPSGELLTEITCHRMLDGAKLECGVPVTLKLWEVTVVFERLPLDRAKWYINSDWPECLISPAGYPDGFVGQENAFGMARNGRLIAGSV